MVTDLGGGGRGVLRRGADRERDQTETLYDGDDAMDRRINFSRKGKIRKASSSKRARRGVGKFTKRLKNPRKSSRFKGAQLSREGGKLTFLLMPVEKGGEVGGKMSPQPGL